MSAQQKSEKIIIVDDEAEVVASLVQLLKVNGFDAVGEVNSQKMLERIDNEYFDIIVTDFKMPKVSGLDIAEKVKQKGIDSDVIIITGYGTMDIAIQSLKNGVYDFLLKPFKYEELLYTIERALERKRLIKENKRLSEERDRHIKELTTLYDINDIVINSTSRDSVLHFATDTLNIGIGIDSAGILLNGSKNSIYSLARGFGKFNDSLPNLSIDLSREPLQDLFEKNDIAEIEDFEFFDINTGNLNGNTPEKLWFIPMKVASILVGFIVVFTTEDEEELSAEKLKLIKVLANQLGPQLKIIEQESNVPAYKEGTLIRLKKRIIKSIQKVEDYKGTVAFLYFRIISKTESKGVTIEKGIDTLGSLIQTIITENDELMQLGLDGYLATLYGKSKIESELVASSMAMDLQSVHPQLISSGMQIKIISQCYPEDNSDATQLFYELIHNYTDDNYRKEPVNKGHRT